MGRPPCGDYGRHRPDDAQPAHGEWCHTPPDRVIDPTSAYLSDQDADHLSVCTEVGRRGLAVAAGIRIAKGCDRNGERSSSDALPPALVLLLRVGQLVAQRLPCGAVARSSEVSDGRSRGGHSVVDAVQRPLELGAGGPHGTELLPPTLNGKRRHVDADHHIDVRHRHESTVWTEGLEPPIASSQTRCASRCATPRGANRALAVGVSFRRSGAWPATPDPDEPRRACGAYTSHTASGRPLCGCRVRGPW
jgi:hypothetical protein